MSPPIRGPEYPCPDLPAPSGGWWADDPVGHSTRNSARGAAPFHGPPKNGSLILTKQGTGCFGNGPNRPHAPAPLTGGAGFVPPNSPAVMSATQPALASASGGFDRFGRGIVRLQIAREIPLMTQITPSKHGCLTGCGKRSQSRSSPAPRRPDARHRISHRPSRSPHTPGWACLRTMASHRDLNPSRA
jgi:hypothetical protein